MRSGPRVVGAVDQTVRQGAAGDPKTASSVRSVNEHPEYAPFGQFVAKSGVWLLSIVKRTYCTPSAPAVRSTSLRWPRSLTSNVPEAACVNVPPSVDVSILNWPVEALPPSPQVAVGSTWNESMSTDCGSFTVMDFGTNTFVGSPLSLPVVEPQPVLRLVSNAPSGPHCGL